MSLPSSTFVTFTLPPVSSPTNPPATAACTCGSSRAPSSSSSVFGMKETWQLLYLGMRYPAADTKSPRSTIFGILFLSSAILASPPISEVPVNPPAYPSVLSAATDFRSFTVQFAATTLLLSPINPPATKSSTAPSELEPVAETESPILFSSVPVPVTVPVTLLLLIFSTTPFARDSRLSIFIRPRRLRPPPSTRLPVPASPANPPA